MDIANGFVAEIAPTEPDGVYSGVGYGIAAGFDVGRYIFIDERTSLYHHMCADVAELMNEAPAANHSVVVDNYFSDMNNSDAIERIEAELPATKERDEIVLFVRNSKRGIIKGYL